MRRRLPTYRYKVRDVSCLHNWLQKNCDLLYLDIGNGVCITLTIYWQWHEFIGFTMCFIDVCCTYVLFYLCVFNNP